MQALPTEPITETRQQITEQGFTVISSPASILQVGDTIPLCLSSGAGFEIGSSPNSDLLPFNSFPFPERTTIRQEQIDFCISQFKAFIPQLVQQNRSPFIHPDSYQRVPPVAYQDLLGVSAMYCHKSPQNQIVIFSMLDSRISSLMQSSKSSWSAKDYLVGLQALIIYQIIRLFDGDVRQRANAERDMGILDAWTCQLHLTENICYNDGFSESPYRHWVFLESIRRTVTMSIMVQAMYSLTKDGFCTSVPLMATLPVSVDGALWDAPEETWWQSTLGFGGDLSTYQDFVNRWNGGQALYTDIYESILLGACRHNLRRPPLMLV
jgi:hypothetical protein